MGTNAGQQNGSTEETSGQEQQGEQQATGIETGQEEQQQSSTQQGQQESQEPVKLPDDHPLVKALAANKDKLSSLNTELREARAQSAKATQLEEELNKRPTTEALETLQTRYDRLEAFLLAAGGPLSKALDSRTFSKDLFETDKDIEDLVKGWQRANPTATSTALGSAGTEHSGGKVDPNALLRAAAGKS